MGWKSNTIWRLTANCTDLGKPKSGVYTSIFARFRGHSITKSSLPNHQLSLTLEVLMGTIGLFN